MFKVGRSLLQKNQQQKNKIINKQKTHTKNLQSTEITHIIYTTYSALIKKIQSKQYSLFTGSMLIRTEYRNRSHVLFQNNRKNIYNLYYYIII